MKDLPFWLKGMIIGLIPALGFFILITMMGFARQGSRGSIEIQNLNGIPALVIILSTITGWVYGKIKNRNRV